MNRIINWVFGSFFRTLGRVFVYILIGFILFNLINLNELKLPNFTDLLFMNVYANYEMGDVISNTTVQMNNYTLTPTNYSAYSPNSNINLHIESPNVWNPQNNDIDYQYGYISLCASNDFNPYNFVAGNYSKNARLFNSYQSCQVDGLSFDNSTVYYITWQINLSNACSTGSTTTYCSLDNNFDFKNTNEVYFSLIDFGLSDTQIQVDTSSGQIIKNQNSNTTNIINNQNQNKTDIINNQNSNTDKEIESQKVCNNIKISKDNALQEGLLDANGNVVANANANDIRVVTDYYNLENVTNLKVLVINNDSGANNLCFYDNAKNKISCMNKNVYNNQTNIEIPTNAKFVRFTISKTLNIPQFEIQSCKNGNQAIGDNLSDIDSSINNSDSSGATSDASNFFSNFTTDTHGLTGIITAPLNAINNLTSQACTPLVLPLPFIDSDLTLPCMRDIYVEHFGSFMTLYDAITLGIVSYWVMVRIFSLVKDFKNPEHDEIEVVDL